MVVSYYLTVFDHPVYYLLYNIHYKESFNNLRHKDDQPSLFRIPVVTLFQYIRYRIEDRLSKLSIRRDGIGCGVECGVKCVCVSRWSCLG